MIMRRRWTWTTSVHSDTLSENVNEKKMWRCLFIQKTHRYGARVFRVVATVFEVLLGFLLTKWIEPIWMFFKSQQSSPPWPLSNWWRVKAVTCHYGNQVHSIARVTDGRSVLTEMSINSSRIATDCTGGHFVYFTLKLYTHRSDVHALYSTENTEWEA